MSAHHCNSHWAVRAGLGGLNRVVECGGWGGGAQERQEGLPHQTSQELLSAIIQKSQVASQLSPVPTGGRVPY
jgi:hypothetical protein